MNTYDHTQALLDAYCNNARLPTVQLDAPGCARLTFAESVVVDVEVDPQGDCIQLHGVLGAVPDTGREALYRHLLESNIYGTATAGGALCIDHTDDSILLDLTLSALTPADEFTRLLDHFAQVVHAWRDHLRSGAWSVAGESMMPADIQRGLQMRC